MQLYYFEQLKLRIFSLLFFSIIFFYIKLLFGHIPLKVFCNYSPHSFSNTGFKNIWTKIKDKAEVENFRFHDLRHTVGTRLAKANVPVPVIREILAHSEIKTTMRYVHTASEELQKAMNVLNSYN